MIKQPRKSIDQHTICNVFMAIITTSLMVLFVLFELNEWGKYVFLGLSICAFAMLIYRTQGEIDIRIDTFLFHSLLFISYIFITSLWAINAKEVREQGVACLKILICLYPIYCYFTIDKDIKILLLSIKWAGYIIALYSVFYYGYHALIVAATSDSNRLGYSFSNVNQLSLVIALSCLIEYWDLCNRRDRWQIIWYIPCALVIFAAQSRKAFIFFVLGIAAISFVKNINKKNAYITILSIIMSISIISIAVVILSRIPALQGIFERLQTLLNLYTGKGRADYSATVRKEIIQAGINVWKSHFLGGIGIGNSHYIALEAVGNDYYLHNNYVELLSGGGIIGAISYYWIHAYCVYLFITRHQENIETISFFLPWLFTILIIDYGMVSYYSKTQWLYIMTLSIAVKSLNRSGMKRANKHKYIKQQ